MAVASSPTACEENVYMAKLVEQYEAMVEFMEMISTLVDNEELSMEEHNLLSVAYKNVIGARWASCRIISSICDGENNIWERNCKVNRGWWGRRRWAVRVGFWSRYF